MIDYGTYEIKKDLITGEYVLTEKLEGKKFYFDSREGLIRYIENDILNLDNNCNEYDNKSWPDLKFMV